METWWTNDDKPMKFGDTHFESSLYSSHSQTKPSIEDSAVENWCNPMEWASPCTQKDSVESFRACARFRIRRVRAWNKCPCICQSEIWANKCWKLSAAWKLFQADSGFAVQKRIEKEHPIKMIKMWISYFPSFLGFYNHGWPLNPPLLQTFVEIEVNAAAEPAAAATLAADQPEDESATSPESWDFARSDTEKISGTVYL